MASGQSGSGRDFREVTDKGFYATPGEARLAAAKALQAEEQRDDSCHVASAETPEVGQADVAAARQELETFFDELDSGSDPAEA